jgi:hypothetical protein
MKMKMYLLRSIVCFLFLISPAFSFAAGLGVYGSFDLGQARVTDKGSDLFLWELTLYERKFWMRQERTDFGLVVDTTIAKDSLFNYRLNIGAGFGQVGVKKTQRELYFGILDYGNPSIRAKYVFRIFDIQMFHSFGFGIVRTPLFRLWVGPQFGYGYADGGYGEVYFKLGPIIGLNFHVSEVVTLFFDAGFRLHTAVAKIPSFFTGYSAFANVGILFRINDTYR